MITCGVANPPARHPCLAFSSSWSLSLASSFLPFRVCFFRRNVCVHFSRAFFYVGCHASLVIYEWRWSESAFFLGLGCRGGLFFIHLYQIPSTSFVVPVNTHLLLSPRPPSPKPPDNPPPPSRRTYPYSFNGRGSFGLTLRAPKPVWSPPLSTCWVGNFPGVPQVCYLSWRGVCRVGKKGEGRATLNKGMSGERER